MSLDSLNIVLQMGAFGGAFLYFVYKIVEGHSSIDMSLEMKPHRRSVPGADVDHLSIDLRLTRGQHGMLEIQDISLRITALDSTEDVDQAIRLGPGEATHFATSTTVPSGCPVFLDVVVAGRRLRSFLDSQWRATCTSLPLARGD
jgi:hypothetical protein